MTFPVAVLASGRGSNLAALIDARDAGRLPIKLTLVASDKADAPALRNAEAHGIPTLALDPKTFASRREFDEALFANVAASGAQLVVLAGYMRILDAAVTAQWVGKMINIHPSLLPKYRGLHTHRRALKAGDTEHGASVHFVSAELDGGPVIAQARIAMHPGDTGDALAARLLPQEHRLLVACVGAIARGEVHEREGKVLFRGHTIPAPLRLDTAGHLTAA
ncbi:MAG: phosphoribosylglycinamide formyltransferase [Xanthomonadaceae bacterium]|nr:phosphoribosylglycinamide formyltransferase [Xanthomonadaceae bacterium]MDE2224114.1 phosphoribosylglycinamide formyltransferase [Xanthomonadaceae bacterium]